MQGIVYRVVSQSAPESMSERPTVECPRCHYRPTPLDRWVCQPDGCGLLWDTFTTGAKCPGCGAQFSWTACPECGEVFSHRAWYRG